MAEQDPALCRTVYYERGIDGACGRNTGQRMVLKELGLPVVEPTIVKDDNMACQPFADNPGNHQWTKHIEVRYHFVTERIHRGSVLVYYVPTSDNAANIFTNVLPGGSLIKFQGMLIVSKSLIKFIV